MAEMIWQALYHPTDGIRVVNSEDAVKTLMDTGFWFDHPLKAQALLKEIELEVQSTEKPARKRRSKKETENG